jgi:RHS repeat-associated protein
VIYENGVQKKLLTEEGYVDLTSGTYYYYLKDHQGNNRVVVNSGGTVTEINHYYPFGGTFASGTVQPYKYNGKELDTKAGLNRYDYGARHYDAALGRFTTQDPLAKDYYATSPYGYCLNNPVKYIDPDGRKIVIGTPMQQFLAKLGLSSYVKKVTKQLEQNNMDSEHIKSIYNKLDRSEHVYKILPLSESPYGTKLGNHVIPNSKTERGKSQGAIMYYDPDMNERSKGTERIARIGLAHEFGHFEDYFKGTVIPVDKKKKEEGDKIERYKVELNEKNSLDLENIIRKILDYDKRESYYIEFKNE